MQLGLRNRRGRTAVDVYWPVFITGTLVLATGVAIIRHRQDSASDVAERQRTVLSRVGEKIASQAKFSGTWGAGIGAILFGMLGIMLAYVVPAERWQW